MFKNNKEKRNTKHNIRVDQKKIGQLIDDHFRVNGIKICAEIFGRGFGLLIGLLGH